MGSLVKGKSKPPDVNATSIPSVMHGGPLDGQTVGIPKERTSKLFICHKMTDELYEFIGSEKRIEHGISIVVRHYRHVPDAEFRVARKGDK